MSKDVEEHRNDKIQDNHFALQMGEATDSNKDINIHQIFDADDLRKRFAFVQAC